MPVEPAMSNSRGNGKGMTMGDAHKRGAMVDVGMSQANEIAAMGMAERNRFAPALPQYDNVNVLQPQRAKPPGSLPGAAASETLPNWYNLDGAFMPVSYSAPSGQKDDMIVRDAVRAAASDAINEQTTSGKPSAVQRTDPISESEIQYVKDMRDMTELAKFDEYVESFIDPRQPGNMKWLMEIYPSYVERRLQQVHTDYEYALRNQMIDTWGISTFDDLHFKYRVDQGELYGPSLKHEAGTFDATYAPGLFSPYQWMRPRKNARDLRLPYTSAKHGKHPQDPASWTIDRSGSVAGRGNTEYEHARAMFGITPSTQGMLNAGQWQGTNSRDRGWGGNSGNFMLNGGNFRPRPGPRAHPAAAAI